MGIKLVDSNYDEKSVIYIVLVLVKKGKTVVAVKKSDQPHLTHEVIKANLAGNETNRQMVARREGRTLL